MTTETGVLKPIEFFTTGVFSYMIGWSSQKIVTLLSKNMFPRSPYVQQSYKWARHCEIQLFTEEMVKEIVELVENHFPPVYKGRQEILKEAYQKDIRDWRVQVKKLEELWNTTDYIEKATPKPKPLPKRRRFAKQ